MKKEMETLTCTRCDSKFERIKARGRKPKLCDDCKRDGTLPTIAKRTGEQSPGAKEESKRRRRTRYEKVYSILEGEVEPNNKALYVPTHMFDDESVALKYAKEIEVVRIEDKTAYVLLNKEVVPTKLSNLHPFTVELITVELNDETESVFA